METIMEEDHEDYNYSSPPSTSMVDYGNTQPNWFQQEQVIQMDDRPDHPGGNFHRQNKYPTKDPITNSNVSQNHNELIENLKPESNQSSRCTSRSSFIPSFIQDSKLVNILFGGSRSNHTQHSNLSTSKHQNHQYQNYSNLVLQRHHQHQNSQLPSNTQNTFLLKTPTKKQRQPPPATSHLNDSAIQHTNDQQMTNLKRSNPPNTSLMVNQTPFSMNASNASIGGNLNAMHNLNNFNTSLSATTMNSQHLSNSHQNLTHTHIGASNISNLNKRESRLQSRKLIETPHDDLTSSTDDHTRFEQTTTNRNHRNLRLNRASTLNQNAMSRYSNLPTAPVLPTFGSSSSAAKNRMSPFMSRLRNSLNNFSSHHYRNFNKLGSRNKRSSFSSAISLKSKCDNPTSDQLVTPNGFHFPQAYVAPKNPNQYLPLHLQREGQENASILTLDQENELNNNVNNVTNLNRTGGQTDKIEIKISPASKGASHRNLNLEQSLSSLNEEENLIVMDDLYREEKNDETAKETEETDQNSNYTIATAAAILKSANENDLAKLKSSNKPIVNNQDSVPMTSGTVTENQSKCSSARSSSPELNPDHQIETNENQSLINKNETETSSSSNSNETTTTTQTTVNNKERTEQEDKSYYSPNEDCHEERYEESPTNSTDSLSPYESNQNTVSSYTQLLEKEKNDKEY